MLVLSRKVGERVYVGDEIVLTILGLRQGRIRLGIAAPPHVVVRREEIVDRVQRTPGLPSPRAEDGEI
jgi:carbon storage regulator